MKIASSPRVEYRNNPLAEVICQIRFERVADIAYSLPAELGTKLEEGGYPIKSIDETLQIRMQFGGNDDGSAVDAVGKIFQFESDDRSWKVSICSEFVSLTCTRYTSWSDFSPRMLQCVSWFSQSVLVTRPVRLGLRYKDVIEREPLGLTGTPWHELIDASLLGPLGCPKLFEGARVDEASVPAFFSQTALSLEDCDVLLQSALLHSQNGDRQAFLIDADFYIDGKLDHDRMRSPDALKQYLETLHSSTGALFRRVITEKLDHALGPNR